MGFVTYGLELRVAARAGFVFGLAVTLLLGLVAKIRFVYCKKGKRDW